MGSSHSRLSPSSAYRWMKCPGAPEAEALAEREDVPSVYALEGSAAHELGERALLDQVGPDELVGRPLPETGHTPDEKMAAFVTEYVEFVRALPGVLEVEQTLDLSEWIGPRGKGTPDAVAIDDELLTVVDLKFGMGKVVHPEWNPQLMIYALGALEEYGWIATPSRVRLVIHQPRLEAVTDWEIETDALQTWGREVLKPAVKAASRPGAARVPGEDQCRWCRANADCAVQKEAAEAAIMALLGDEPPDPAGLSDDELGRALAWRGFVQVWFKGVEERVRERVENGGFPGWKLVHGRGSRVWEDEGAEAAVLKLLGDDAWIRKMVSPAQAEKLLPKDRRAELKPLILSKLGKPTLVPEADKRPAITATAEDFG